MSTLCIVQGLHFWVFVLVAVFFLEVDALRQFLFSFLCSDSSTVPLEVAATVCIDNEVKALPILFPGSSSPGPLLPWPRPHGGFIILLFVPCPVVPSSLQEPCVEDCYQWA